MIPHDEFALPRDPTNAIHLYVGSWSYRTETSWDDACSALSQGWTLLGFAVGGGFLLKYTHWQRLT